MRCSACLDPNRRDPMLCKDVMLTLVFQCMRDTSAEACAQVMRDEHLGFLPVIDANGALIGVVTDRDLAVRVMAARKPGTTPVGEIMSSGPFLVCQPDDDLRSLERRMAEAKKSRAVVCNALGAVVGIISLSDIAQSERSASRTGQLLREVTHRESAVIARP
jgi:CBS domain-containing protein